MTATAILMKEIESLPQECVEEVLDFTIFLKRRKHIGQVAETEEEYYEEIRQRLADVEAGRNIVYNNLIEITD